MRDVAKRHKKVVIAHYRVGRTDGVSLEVEKRKRVLERIGMNVVTVGGPVSTGADYIVDQLEFDTDSTRRIRRNSFDSLSDFASGLDLLKDIQALAHRLRQELAGIMRAERPDHLLVHNVFSHGRHIAAAMAFSDLVADQQLPTLATHHDFYWERPEYQRATCNEVESYLHRNVPPRHPLIRHAVISTLAREHLRNKRGILAEVIPDTFDFARTPWVKDRFNFDFERTFDINPGDLVVLQATRVVERKGIEIAVELVRRLSEPGLMERLRGRRLYNGKTIARDGRVVFLVAGYAERDSVDYLGVLRRLCRDYGIEARFVGDRISAERESDADGKRYSLWDCYAFADAVTYPSQHEGWGNQFIEAVFALKPIILFEYPVFKTDIAPYGYRVISLGDHATQDPATGLCAVPEQALGRAASELVEVLLAADTNSMLDRNFTIGRTHHSLEALSDRLREAMVT